MECEEHLKGLGQLPGGCIAARKETASHHGGPNRNREFLTRPLNMVLCFYQHLIVHILIEPLEKPLCLIFLPLEGHLSTRVKVLGSESLHPN